jgi:hypothetical protein
VPPEAEGVGVGEREQWNYWLSWWLGVAGDFNSSEGEAEGVGFLGERFAREKREDSLGEGDREVAMNCDCWEKDRREKNARKECDLWEEDRRDREAWEKERSGWVKKII